MGRTYTSMRGKEVDMEKMSMRFEKTSRGKYESQCSR